MLSLLIVSNDCRLRSIWFCTYRTRISLLINWYSFFLLYYFLADRELGTFYNTILIEFHCNLLQYTVKQIKKQVVLYSQNWDIFAESLVQLLFTILLSYRQRIGVILLCNLNSLSSFYLRYYSNRDFHCTVYLLY